MYTPIMCYVSIHMHTVASAHTSMHSRFKHSHIAPELVSQLMVGCQYPNLFQEILCRCSP